MAMPGGDGSLWTTVPIAGHAVSRPASGQAAGSKLWRGQSASRLIVGKRMRLKAAMNKGEGLS